jgi:hypothetical protein
MDRYRALFLSVKRNVVDMGHGVDVSMMSSISVENPDTENEAEGDRNIVNESMTTTQENQSENIVNESSVIEFTTQENQSDVMEEESLNNSSSATLPMPSENPHITRKSSRLIISDSNNDSSDSESFGGGVGPAPWAKSQQHKRNGESETSLAESKIRF